MMYKVKHSKQAKKDAVNIRRSGLRPQVEEIIATIEQNPYERSQSFKELKGRLKGKYSRRINDEHRFVYEVRPNTENEKNEKDMPYKGIIWTLSMWSHYESI